MKIIGGVVTGKELKHALNENTELHQTLTIIVLPFEEVRGLESARLERCPAAFAYVNPDTGEASTMPACSWLVYKNDVLRKTSEIYGTVSMKEPATQSSS